MKKKRAFAILLAALIVMACMPARAYGDTVSVGANGLDSSPAGSHTLVIKSDGSLWAWGNNRAGQLGDGTEENRLTPVKIMDDVTAVSAFDAHNLAVKSDGSLWAWGGNWAGQLGDGTTEDKLTPVKIMEGVAAVSGSGTSHMFVVKQDGSLWAWGNNNCGQLGDGTTEDKLIPVKIMDGVTSASAGNRHILAVKSDGSLWAWGDNWAGQLGDGTTEDKLTPVKIMEGVAAVSASGNAHTLAVKSDGSLWAWGNNRAGQLGNGTKDYNPTPNPTPVKIMNGVTSASAGNSHSLAVKSDGSLWAWGDNSFGQLTEPKAEQTAETAPARSEARLILNSTRRGGINAVGSTGYNVGGHNYFNLRAIATLLSNTPSQFDLVWNEATSQTEIITGRTYSSNTVGPRAPKSPVARTTTVTVPVDGAPVDFAAYNIAEGETDKYQLKPVKIMDDVTAAIASNNDRSLAVKSDGSLWAWGYNGRYNQLNSDVTAQTGISIPVKIFDDVMPPAETPAAGQPPAETPDGATDVITPQMADHNYFKLSDIADIIPFYVDWSEEENAALLTPYASDLAVRADRGGVKTIKDLNNTGRRMTTYYSVSNYSSTALSYLKARGDALQALEVNPSAKTIVLDTYDKNFDLLSTKTIPFECELFGGFYAGERCNYLVFGSDNKEENDGKEVVRVVKYDENFNRLDDLSVSGGESHAATPFSFASSGMAEYGNVLVLHTTRARYAASDGANHQSQLTLVIDTNQMRLLNVTPRLEFQGNHVSHSFNQFVRFDNGQHVLVDLGDAYPRAVVLHKSQDVSNDKYAMTELLHIPGQVGDNYTGVNLGGFEITRSSYVVALNQAKSDSSRERDVLLLVSPRDNINGAARTVTLAEYDGRGKLGSMPYLVRAGDDDLVALWEEYTTETSTESGTLLKYAKLDGSGNIKGSVQSVEHAYLSKDCQPVMFGRNLVWYVDDGMGRMFFRLNVDAA
ncbi:MAG: hypothetical protein LBS62_09180 [Clostridiales bacterium]|jgi:alpha-tubulin suppressor-like RCC1 family protein|nr:hypothetical protein [Clostridiales bacterium]